MIDLAAAPAEDIPRDPAKRLDWLICEVLGLNYSEAARQMGSTHSSVMNWASGKIIPDELNKRVIAIWTGAHETPPRRAAIFEADWPKTAKEIERLKEVAPYPRPVSHAA